MNHAAAAESLILNRRNHRLNVKPELSSTIGLAPWSPGLEVQSRSRIAKMQKRKDLGKPRSERRSRLRRLQRERVRGDGVSIDLSEEASLPAGARDR